MQQEVSPLRFTNWDRRLPLTRGASTNKTATLISREWLGCCAEKGVMNAVLIGKDSAVDY